MIVMVVRATAGQKGGGTEGGKKSKGKETRTRTREDYM